MPKTVLEFGEWTPDQGPINNQGLWFAKNAIKINDNYENSPLFALTNTAPGSGAADPLGTHYHVKRAGKPPLMFFGTSDKIYVSEHIDTPVWADASASAYTATNWEFASFGPTVVATNGVDAMQGYSVADTFNAATNFASLLVTTSPTTANIKPKFIATHKNHIFAANITMAADWPASSPQFSNGTLYQELVWWSDTDNATRFGDLTNSPTLKNSGWFLLYDRYGAITGLGAGLDTLYVFKNNAIYRCDGSPFTFSPVAYGTGTAHSKSIKSLDGEVYFWSETGPCKIGLDGNVERFGQDSCYRSLIDSLYAKHNAFYNSSGTFSIKRDDGSKVWTAVDATNKLVLFFISTADSDNPLDDGDYANSILVLNAITKKLYYCEAQVYQVGSAVLATIGYPMEADIEDGPSEIRKGTAFRGVFGVGQNAAGANVMGHFTYQHIYPENDYVWFELPFTRFGDGASRITKIRPLLSIKSTSAEVEPSYRIKITTRQQFFPGPGGDTTPISIDSNGSKAGWIDTGKCPTGITHSIAFGVKNGGVAESTQTMAFRDISGIEVEYAVAGVRSA